jgi:hypothetical protein
MQNIALMNIDFLMLSEETVIGIFNLVKTLILLSLSLQWLLSCAHAMLLKREFELG